AVSGLLLATTAAPAHAEEILTIRNATGYTISEIYIAPTRTTNWEEDVMGRDALANGATVRIDFSGSEETCNWDMKAVYDDGDTAVWSNFNLCELSTITLRYNANTGTTSAEYE